MSKKITASINILLVFLIIITVFVLGYKRISEVYFADDKQEKTLDRVSAFAEREGYTQYFQYEGKWYGNIDGKWFPTSSREEAIKIYELGTK